MKKFKLLAPILGLTTMAGIVLPVAGCSCSKQSNERNVVLEEGYKDLINVTNTKFKDGSLAVSLIPIKDKQQVEKIESLKFGNYELKNEEYEFHKASGALVFQKNVLDAHGGDIFISLSLSNKKPRLVDLSFVPVPKENPMRYFENDAVKASQWSIVAKYKYGEDKVINLNKPDNPGYFVFDHENDVTSTFDTDGVKITNDDVISNNKYLSIKYSEVDEYGYTIPLNKTLILPICETMTIDSSQTVTSFDVGEEFNANGILVWGWNHDHTFKQKIELSQLKFYLGTKEIKPKIGSQGYKFLPEDHGKDKEVTVSYNGHTSTYKINILDQRDHAVFAKNEGTAKATVTITKGKDNYWPDIQYTTDPEAASDTWIKVEEASPTFEIPAGGSVFIMGVNKGDESLEIPGGLNEAKITISGTGAKVNLSGESASLLNGASRLVETNYPNSFVSTFEGSDAIVSIDKDFISSRVVYNNCYKAMFKNCKNLETGPDLKANKLMAQSCYESMFEGCSNLKTLPDLPTAEQLNISCYKAMFKGCTKLTDTPIFTNVTMGSYCFESMFEGCTSLEIAPELPATTLAEGSYKSMFKGCTGLKQVQEIKVITPNNNCCEDMFNGCTSLKIYDSKNPRPKTAVFFFTCPSYGSSTTDPFKNMFANTGEPTKTKATAETDVSYFYIPE